jgi:uncharacterized membrane protein YebE (DUF533 family)
MLDAKSILDALVRGAAPQSAPAQASGGGLGDILGQLTKMAQQGAGAPAQASAADTGSLGGLGDILGKLGQAASGAAGSAGSAAGGLGGGLGDILGKLQQAAGGAAASAGSAGGGLGDILGKLQQQAAGAGGGNLMDVLKQVLAQATDGAREGATRIGAATGATDALGRATGGMSTDDAMAKLKDLIAQHQMEAGAAAGGLGAIVLGTHAGRTIAASAVKLGALALIGGLAYKALLNYQNGQPLITGAHTLAEPAPAGSGFEPAAVTNESALLYIKAMIAAAAADGRIDQSEMTKIMGAEKQGGLGEKAEEFLANELNNPASVDDLAELCQSPEQAVQVYTAARLAVTPDGGAEDAFLAALADKLGIDAKLAAHIDAATKSAS